MKYHINTKDACIADTIKKQLENNYKHVNVSYCKIDDIFNIWYCCEKR